MVEQLKNQKKVIVICTMLVIFLAALFISQFSESRYVQAASGEYGRLYDNGSNKQVKAGKRYYTFNSSGLYISNKKGVQGKLILSLKKGGASLCDQLYFSKKYIYYAYYKKKSISVYRMKLNGTGKKKLVSTKCVKFDPYEGLFIEFVYNDRYVLLQRNILEAARTYSIDIKSKKVKAIAVNGKKQHNYLDYKSDHYKFYYVATGSYMDVGEVRPVYSYNAKKQSVQKLEDNARGIAIGGKNIYYIEFHQGDSIMQN